VEGFFQKPARLQVHTAKHIVSRDAIASCATGALIPAFPIPTVEKVFSLRSGAQVSKPWSIDALIQPFPCAELVFSKDEQAGIHAVSA